MVRIPQHKSFKKALCVSKISQILLVFELRHLRNVKLIVDAKSKMLGMTHIEVVFTKVLLLRLLKLLKL